MESGGGQPPDSPPPGPPDPPGPSDPPDPPERPDPQIPSLPPEGPANRPTGERPLPANIPTREPTTAERRAISQRRRRHRDLPAKVRRRQAIAAGVLVLVAIFAVYKLIDAVFGSDGKSAPPVTIEKLVGQTVIGKLGGRPPDKDLLKRVKAGKVGGFVVFPQSPARLKQDVADLQAAAKAGGNPPLLIAIDQEGGPVRRLKGPPDVSPAQLGKDGDTDKAKSEGEKTGKLLAGLGVNVDFAPVADVSHPQAAKSLRSRTFGDDPEAVAKMVTAFAQGLQDGGVVPTVKHFPGLGFATANTDFAAAKIDEPRGNLEIDLEPFKQAIDDGVPLVMTSTAFYTALDTKDPAAWSAPIINEELRDRLGFDGAIITDDLQSAAVRKLGSPESAALKSLNAGGDMVLFATGVGSDEGAYKSLLKAAKAGTLTRDTLESAYDHITALKDGFDSPGD
jgi:beta-N-acetylhexosaminidase